MTDEQLFALFFAQSCCIQFHPANHAVDNEEISQFVINRCHELAYRMLLSHRERFPREDICL